MREDCLISQFLTMWWWKLVVCSVIHELHRVMMDRKAIVLLWLVTKDQLLVLSVNFLVSPNSGMFVLPFFNRVVRLYFVSVCMPFTKKSNGIRSIRFNVFLSVFSIFGRIFRFCQRCVCHLVHTGDADQDCCIRFGRLFFQIVQSFWFFHCHLLHIGTTLGQIWCP